MLYRPQSIFLVTTIIALCLAIFMLICGTTESELKFKLEREYHLDSSSLGERSHGSPLSVMPSLLVLLVRSLDLIAVLIAIYSLFRYDNRVFQLKLGLLNAYVLAILLGLALYLSIQRQKEIQLLLHCLLSAMALISNLLANHYIRQDENLVKSAERMR